MIHKILLLLAFIAGVYGYSEKAGTCNADAKEILDVGKLKMGPEEKKLGFKLDYEPKRTAKIGDIITVTVSGESEFKGLLLYGETVQGYRFGEFSKPGDGFAHLNECKDFFS